MSPLTANAIRIILCGKNPQIGRIVSENLKPEITVTQFVSTMKEGHELIPKLLTNPSDIQGVVLGAGYTSEMQKELRLDTVGKESYKQVPWLVADTSQVQGIGPRKAPSVKDIESYAKQGAERVKNVILGMKEDGRWNDEVARHEEPYMY
jgi:hypothetical protein